MPELSIVTVAYQSAAKLPHFLTSARSVAPAAEYVVVDNASGDSTADTARQHGAHQVLSSATNLGFGRACNLGAEHATGDWLLFANPDLIIESVPALGHRPHGSYGVAGGWLSEHTDAYRPSLRAELTLAEEAVAQLLARLTPTGISRMLPQRRRPARWASGALLLCRKDEFLEVGGFDRRFFLYFEDRDLATRYRRRGYSVHLESGLRGSHGHGQSSAGVASWLQEAWSLVSWIEYRGIWHGSSSARRTARLVLSTLSSVGLLARHTHSDRIGKKAEDVAYIVTFLENLQQHLKDMPDFYPLARTALNSAYGSSQA